MTSRVLAALLLVISVLVIWILLGKISAEKKRADDANLVATQRQQTIDDLQKRQRDVAALDAKYTGELADAQNKIDQLQSDVVAGRKRLQLNATCKKQSATGTSSMGDDATARLNDSAQRDYFTLRERITTITGQVKYLQQYIREQCLK